MKTITLECYFIRGRLEGVIGRKAIGTLNFATRSTDLAPKMRSDVDDLNIKVIPLGDLKLCMPKTLLLEAILLAFCTLPKFDVNNHDYLLINELVN